MSNSFTFCNLFTLKKPLKVKRNILSQTVVLFFLVYISEKKGLLNKIFMARQDGLSFFPPFSAENNRKVSVDNHTSKPG